MNLKERMAIIETLMKNHLRHHDMWLRYLIAPVVVGIVLNICGLGFIIVKLVVDKVI